MRDESMTHAQLIKELAKLRQQIAGLEKADAERARAEEIIRRERETLALVNALNHAANRQDSLQEIIRLFDHLARDVFSVQAASVYLLSQDKEYLVLQNIALPANLVRRIEKLTGKIPEVKIRPSAGSVYAEILQAGKPRITNDVAIIRQMMAECTEDKVLRRLVPAISRILKNICSVMSVPLVIDGEAIGLVDMSRREPFSESDVERLAIIAGQFTAIFGRKRAEEALAEKTIYLDNILRSATEYAIVTTDLDFRITYYNPLAEQFFGYTAEKVTGKTVQEMHTQERVSPDRFEKAVENVRAHGEHRYRVEQEGENGTRYLDSRVSGIYDSDSELVGFALFSRDVTERVQAEELDKASLREKEVLLREIHHRVKNNLQFISSLLNLQMEHTTDAQVIEMFDESRNRIRSMALIHERLYQSPDLAQINFGEYVRNLTTQLFRAYEASVGAIALEVDAQDMTLSIDVAVPCGMIISELVSNSLKHAFPGGRKGRILVRLGSEGGLCRLVVSDDGIGLPAGLDFRRTESLGLQLVIMLVEQLEGVIELDRQKGTAFEIEFAV